MKKQRKLEKKIFFSCPMHTRMCSTSTKQKNKNTEEDDPRTECFVWSRPKCRRGIFLSLLYSGIKGHGTVCVSPEVIAGEGLIAFCEEINLKFYFSMNLRKNDRKEIFRGSKKNFF